MKCPHSRSTNLCQFRAHPLRETLEYCSVCHTCRDRKSPNDSVWLLTLLGVGMVTLLTVGFAQMSFDRANTPVNPITHTTQRF
ncbi:MAG: hypothetical protein HC881_01845 [Leptolyngbyaceae cyanobacterium SL_7_1]|nr:hypothetical protein [Leptolyngbyaceae cyanobacterium SL_7_1]